MRRQFSILVIFLLLLLISCSEDPIDKANAFIEINDYSNAIGLLGSHLRENPKDTEARKLLIQCYEINGQYEKEAEQLDILTKIDTSKIFVYKQMRLYAQLGYWNKLKELKVFIEQPRIDTVSSIDYILAIGLLELHNDNKNKFIDLFRRVVELESEYRKYLIYPVSDYLNNIEKPIMKDYVLKPGNYFNDIQNYHNFRGDLYEIIAKYSKALEEYNSELSWYKYSPNPDVPAYIKYTDKIDLLRKTNNYSELIQTANELKNVYGEKDSLNIVYAEIWMGQARKGF